MTSISASPKRALIALLAVSVGLIIAALIVVSLRPTPPMHEADTPSGVVQRYLLAFQSSDLATAQTYVENGHDKQVCDTYTSSENSTQVALIREVTSDQLSTITVSMTYSEDGLLGIDSYESQDIFELEQINGTWLITTAPWQIGLCTAEELGL
ncbi:hypothetical protein [Glutamicibacter sp. NPDC087344]|uniref:hypothetical protein n=1 Tax=Glutamicibacter sp. NPDC087344 TaxID=3363994 RepID=UPI003805CD17